MEKNDKLNYAWTLLVTNKIEDKISNSHLDLIEYKNNNLPLVPGRPKELQFSEKKIKFPKPKSWIDKERKAIALHFFANHELLAIDIMSLALLRFKDHPGFNDYSNDIIETIQDEQRHLGLYRQRINELGYEFGDFPVNDFFWSHFSNIKKVEEYFSVMALTFEAANLDFSFQYLKEFKDMDDIKSANVMAIVLRDEIQHVAYGVKWLNKWRLINSGTDLWNYYQENLPKPLSPARSKGNIYNKELRIKAGLDNNFCEQLEKHNDGFNVTNRKNWK